MNHVAIAFDNQADYSLVLIKNILGKSISKDFFFHIFISNLTDYDWHHKWLLENNVLHEIYIINQNELQGMSIDRDVYTHITDASYYRLLMPSKLSELKCFLYLDTDIYVNCDLSTIFNFCSEDKSISVASEGKSFNAGVLLINPERFNKELPLKKAIDLFNEHKFVSDNKLLVHHFKDFNILGMEYNANPVWYTKKSTRIDYDGPKIVHFMGTAKPWRYSTVLPFAREWRELYFNVHKRNPWNRITVKEFLLRMIYVIFPNPSVLFCFQNYYRRLSKK